MSDRLRIDRPSPAIAQAVLDPNAYADWYASHEHPAFLRMGSGAKFVFSHTLQGN
jgi:hypothetical protein